MMTLKSYDVVSNTNSGFTLARTCPFCGKRHTITIDYAALLDGIRAYNDGKLLQDAFPTFTRSEREFLLTGICDECWDNM